MFFPISSSPPIGKTLRFSDFLFIVFDLLFLGSEAVFLEPVLLVFLPDEILGNMLPDDLGEGFFLSFKPSCSPKDLVSESKFAPFS